MVVPWGPKGAQGSPKSDFGHIGASFWEPSGSTFGVIFAQKLKSEGLCRLFGASKTGAKQLPKVIKKGAFWEAVDMAQV